MSSTLLVLTARAFAREAHATQRRKGSGEPYFVHLESVVARLLAHGHGDELTLAAGYLHDVLEDQPSFGSRLRAEFPSELVTTVELLSEARLDAEGKLRPKADRFADYLAGLSAETPHALRARIVSCADKLDNALSLVDAERRGMGLLAQLRTLPEQHAAHLAALRRLYAPVVRPSLLAAFDDAGRALDEIVRAHLSG
jgi:(p)ppGpp synthase/HD superfamily hydrolase